MEGTDQTLWWNRQEVEHGGITFWGWLIVGTGLLLDVSAQAQRAMSVYQQSAS